MHDFDNHGLRDGVWSGVLRSKAEPLRVALHLAGDDIAEARISAGHDGDWLIEVSLPLDGLSEGARLYQLVAELPTGEQSVLASLPLMAGEQLDGDMRAEMALLRAEMELLKREFRRLAGAR